MKNKAWIVLGPIGLAPLTVCVVTIANSVLKLFSESVEFDPPSATLILLSVGAIGALLALLFNTAPALLSRWGLGPELKLLFAPSKEGNKKDNIFVHPWSGEDHGPVQDHDGRFIRFQVQNSGYIGAQNVECTITNIAELGEHNQRKPLSIGPPKTLRWAHTWKEPLAIVRDTDARTRRHRVNRQTDFRHPTINPGSSCFIDFGFILPVRHPTATSKEHWFYKALRSRQTSFPRETWCLHLAEADIPNTSSFLHPGTAYELTMNISARNYHGTNFIVEVRLSKDLADEIDVSDIRDRAPNAYIAVHDKQSSSNSETRTQGDAETSMQSHLTRWHHEDILVNHRTTWLLQFQAILFAAYSLLSVKDVGDISFKAKVSYLPHLAIALCLVAYSGICAALCAQLILWRDNKILNRTLHLGVRKITTLWGWHTPLLTPIACVFAWLTLVTSFYIALGCSAALYILSIFPLLFIGRGRGESRKQGVQGGVETEFSRSG